MVIFHSYVSLPEGNINNLPPLKSVEPQADIPCHSQRLFYSNPCHMKCSHSSPSEFHDFLMSYSGGFVGGRFSVSGKTTYTPKNVPQLSGSRLGSSIQCNVPLLYRQCLRCSIEQITMLIDIVSINEFFFGWSRVDVSRYSHCQRFSFHQRSKRLLSALSLLLTFNDSCVLVNVGVPSAKDDGYEKQTWIYWGLGS